jgi:hypothetical protein
MVFLLALLVGCGGGSKTASPAPAATSDSPENAVKNFMQAIADSNITRMSQLWGTAKGPAAETKKPDDYEKRMVITQLYLRGAPYRIIRVDPVTDDAAKKLVTVDLNRGECTKTVPVTVVNTGNNNWIVNQIDLNLAGTPVRPCEPAVPEEPTTKP